LSKKGEYHDVLFIHYFDWCCCVVVSVFGCSADIKALIMEVVSVIHFYGTQELSKCYDFYVNTLGFALYKDQGLCHIYQLTNSSFIGFCEHLPVVSQERSPIITLVVGDVWKVYHLWSQWQTLEEPTISSKFNIEHFFAKDPNGYTLEVQRFM
jgi:catechol 2,3-dioxygenase-like lactoylglutathione lyase family enzyme